MRDWMGRFGFGLSWVQAVVYLRINGCVWMCQYEFMIVVAVERYVV